MAEAAEAHSEPAAAAEASTVAEVDSSSNVASESAADSAPASASVPESTPAAAVAESSAPSPAPAVEDPPTHAEPTVEAKEEENVPTAAEEAKAEAEVSVPEAPPRQPSISPAVSGALLAAECADLRKDALKQARATENDRISAEAGHDVIEIGLLDTWVKCVHAAMDDNDRLLAFFKERYAADLAYSAAVAKTQKTLDPDVDVSTPPPAGSHIPGLAHPSSIPHTTTMGAAQQSMILLHRQMIEKIAECCTVVDQRIVIPLATMGKQYRKSVSALIDSWVACKEAYQEVAGIVVGAFGQFTAAADAPQPGSAPAGKKTAAVATGDTWLAELRYRRAAAACEEMRGELHRTMQALMSLYKETEDARSTVIRDAFHNFGQVTQYWCSNVPVREVLDTAQGISTFSDSCAVMNASVPTQAHDESAAAPAPTAGGQSRYTHLRAISSAKLTPFTTLPPIRSPLVVRVGMLLRQSTVLKSWKKAVVVLTVDGYLHVFEKSGDVLAGDSDVEALTTAPLRHFGLPTVESAATSAGHALHGVVSAAAGALASVARPRTSSTGSTGAGSGSPPSLPPPLALDHAKECGAAPFLTLCLAGAKHVSPARCLADGSFEVIETVPSMLLFKSDKKITLKADRAEVATSWVNSVNAAIDAATAMMTYKP